MPSRSHKSTSSETELTKFTELADLWWNTSGPFAQLHKLNPPRLKFITKNLADYYKLDLKSEKPLNGLKVLDIGCGGGILCEPLARLGANVTGIDAGSQNIMAAKKHAQTLNLKIAYLTILPEEMVKYENTFDLVINMEVVEHTKNIDLFLKSSCSLVRPNGVMAISTLNRTMKSFIFAKVGAEYVLRWLPIGTHNWEQFVKPAELCEKLRQNDLIIKNTAGIGFNPLTSIWEINNDLRVNYIAFGEKTN